MESVDSILSKHIPDVIAKAEPVTMRELGDWKTAIRKDLALIAPDAIVEITLLMNTVEASVWTKPTGWVRRSCRVAYAEAAS